MLELWSMLGRGGEKMTEVIIPVKINLNELKERLEKEVERARYTTVIDAILRKKAIEILATAIENIKIEPEIVISKKEIMMLIREHMDKLIERIAKLIAKELVKRIHITIEEEVNRE